MDAIGMVETNSYVAAVQAAEAMVRAANVEIVGVERSGAHVTVIARGNPAAARSAVSAGGRAAERLGGLVASEVICAPAASTEKLLPTGGA